MKFAPLRSILEKRAIEMIWRFIPFAIILSIGGWIRYQFLSDFPFAFGHSDTIHYTEPVVQLFEEHIFVPHPFRVVGTYSFFIYFILRYLGSTPYSIVLIQTLLGMISGLLVFFIISRLTQSKILAHLGLLVTLILPKALYYEHIILAESLYVFLLLAFLAIALVIYCKLSWYSLLCFGTLSGLLLLTRGHGLLAAPLGLAFILYLLLRNPNWRRLWFPYLLLFAIPQATMVAGYIQNNLKYNDFPSLGISGTCTWFWIGAGRFIDFRSDENKQLKNYVKRYVYQANKYYSGREEWGIHEEAMRVGKMPFLMEFEELFHGNLRDMNRAERQVALEATLSHPLAIMYRVYWNSVQLFYHMTSLRHTDDIRGHYLRRDGRFYRIDPKKAVSANKNGLKALHQLSLPLRFLDHFRKYNTPGYLSPSGDMTTIDYVLHYLGRVLTNFRIFSILLYLSLIILFLQPRSWTAFYLFVFSYMFGHLILTLFLINTLVDRYFIPIETTTIIVFAAASATCASCGMRANMRALVAICSVPLFYATGYLLFSYLPLPYPLPIDGPILGLDPDIAAEHQRTILSVLSGILFSIVWVFWLKGTAPRERHVRPGDILEKDNPEARGQGLLEAGSGPTPTGAPDHRDSGSMVR